MRGQTERIDSLQMVVKTMGADTNKVNTLSNLGWELINTGDYDKALQLAQEAKELAAALQYNVGISDAYNNTGVVYWMQGKYDAALDNFFNALTIRKQLSKENGMAQCYNNIGLVYFNMGLYAEALKNMLAAMKIYEKLDRKRGVAGSYTNIAAIYEAQGNNTEALKNYMAALNISKDIGNQAGIAKAYEGAGNVYANIANYTEALKNHLSGLNIFTELKYLADAADEYNNIGNVYAQQAAMEKDNSKQKELYDESLKNYFSSLSLREELGNQEGIATSLGNIGAANLDLKRYKEAESYSLKALKLAKETGALERVKEAQENLAKVYTATGRHKQALASFKAFIAARDSLVNEENTKKTVQLEMQYTFDKKEEATRLEQERKDALALADKRRQNIILLSVSGLGILVLGFAIFAYRSYLQKQKANIEITKQKYLIEEKQKEILDSIHYAKRIQTALITSEQYIARNLARMKKSDT